MKKKLTQTDGDYLGRNLDKFMPYIKKDQRPRYNNSIKEITKLLLEKYPGDNGKDFDEGDLNYVISVIIYSLFDSSPSYKKANKLMGVLSGVDKEFYRRKVAELENRKIIENGDII